MANKLHVHNLTISFRTNDGKLQAVRGINFDLEEGETLAIVGESGSGKSVTSKAILGILAGNSIIEDGEIIYDGRDLLKINEEDFHKIRGDKIAMIFQDPMSSLNPIVKIGKQLTEAMILKGKARQRENRASFNTYLGNLNKVMIDIVAEDFRDRSNVLDIKTRRVMESIPKSQRLGALAKTAKCKKFNKFEYKHLALETAYNTAHDAAIEAISEIESLAFEIEKKAATDAIYRIKRVCKLALLSVQTYVVNQKADKLKALVASALENSKLGKRAGDYMATRANLLEISQILQEAVEYPVPNFFSLGYYVAYSGQPIPNVSVEKLNAFTRKYLDDHFMLDFIVETKAAVIFSAAKTCKNRLEAVKLLKDSRAVFEKEQLDKKECWTTLRTFDKAVKKTIDPLALTKDSMIYTFTVGLKTEINRYFNGIVKNVSEQKRFEKETEKYNRILSKGKQPNGKVIAASITDLEAVRGNMLRQIDNLIAHYEAEIAAMEQRDFDADSVAVIDYLKACASGVVNKVTKRMAKDRALKLMQEVGIDEPRRRFNQYPFEFSGGMRQRIVIAIALAANPDILICDEPTTALDVTIQSQILELINNLKATRNLSVIFITHDLGVVANMADRIAVMYAGKIVEYGTSADVFYRAAHPYTWALLSSMPDLDTNEKLDAIPGTPPNMIYPPVGDAFAARNKYAMKIDFERQPPMFQISDTHYAATWLLHPDAPKVERPQIITDRIERMKAKREANDGN